MKIEKFIVIRVLKAIVKYVLPAVIGWLEGNAHTIEDAIVSLIDLL